MSGFAARNVTSSKSEVQASHSLSPTFILDPAAMTDSETIGNLRCQMSIQRLFPSIWGIGVIR
jgi:hypothetical protein